MAGYFENTTLGMTSISLKGNTANKEMFVGSEILNGKNTHDTAATAKGLDWGSDAGTFHLKLNFNVRCIRKISVGEVGEGETANRSITFNIYSSNDNSTFSKIGSYTTTIDALNAVKLKNNMAFSALPTMGRYFNVGIITGQACTDGEILISCDPKGY